MKKIKPLFVMLFFLILFSGCRSTGKNQLFDFSLLDLESPEKLVFAHRGLCDEYPENSLEAFKAAYNQGFRGIELDIRFTKDNVPVVFHDEKLKRMSGINTAVSSLDYNEISKIKIGNKKQIKSGRTSFIPSFEEYCSWVCEKKDVVTIIELKSEKDWLKGNEKILVDMIRSFGLSDRVIFISFDLIPLVLIKNEFPGMKCSIISDNKKLDVCTVALENGLDGVSVQWKLAKTSLIERCHRNNIFVNVWTADSYEEAFSFFEKGADFVTGNF